jgi:hypothetical protein
MKLKTFESYVNDVPSEEDDILKAIEQNKKDSTFDEQDIASIKLVLSANNIPIEVLQIQDDQTAIIDLSLVKNPNIDIESLYDLLSDLDGMTARFKNDYTIIEIKNSSIVD